MADVAVQANEAEQGSGEPGATGTEKNKTKVRQVIAKFQAQKTKLKGAKHYYRGSTTICQQEAKQAAL